MKKLISILAITGLVLAACSSVDCSINNHVGCTWKLEYAEGDDVTPTYFLSFYAQKVSDGNDTVLANRLQGAKSVVLPMSHAMDADTLTLKVEGSNGVIGVDGIVVQKTNTPIFETVDCDPRFHHTITGIDYSRQFIDTIIITNPTVNNLPTDENIRIVLRSAQ